MENNDKYSGLMDAGIGDISGIGYISELGKLGHQTISVPKGIPVPKGDTYTLREFQDDALRFARYPEQGKQGGLIYTVLALCGEAGELANKLKKHMRDGAGKPVPEEVLADELGDVLWYVAAASRELNRSLGDLALMNIEKLRLRAMQNKKDTSPICKLAPSISDEDYDTICKILGRYR